MKKLEVIKLLPVEDRAKMKKKEMPSEVALLIFVFGFVVGYTIGALMNLSSNIERYHPFGDS